MNISDISDVDNITDSDSDSMPEGLHELSFTDSESEASEDLDDIRNTAFIPEGEEERVVVSHEVVANDNVNHDEEDDELNTAFLDLSPEMEEALRALQQQQGSQESE